MPGFILNTPPKRSEYHTAHLMGGKRPPRLLHPFYNLSDFAKGYVEAMFFTNGDTGDDREDLPNELGVARLTKEAVADIEGDCLRFWQDSKADLEAAMGLEPGSDALRYSNKWLTPTRLGHLFWYARQGHGVAFTDDSLPGAGDCLERLQEAAQGFGSAYCEVWRGWIYHR